MSPAATPGSVAQGDLVPLFAVWARVTTIVPVPLAEANAGDLDRDAGVRWLVDAPGQAPSRKGAHAEPWAARQSRLCFPRGGEDVCLR